MPATRPGECIDKGPLISQIDFTPFRMHVATDRYHSRDYHERERALLWRRIVPADVRPSAREFHLFGLVTVPLLLALATTALWLAVSTIGV